MVDIPSMAHLSALGSVIVALPILLFVPAIILYKSERKEVKCLATGRSHICKGTVTGKVSVIRKSNLALQRKQFVSWAREA